MENKSQVKNKPLIKPTDTSKIGLKTKQTKTTEKKN